MRISKNSKVLIVAAHPDDEVLGMGGTIARFKKMGAEIIVQFLGEGISARFEKAEFNNWDYQQATKIRKRGAEKALEFLGVSKVIFGEHNCCRFDNIELLDLVKEIERSIDIYRPTDLFTHNPLEVNIDHRITYRAVETAVRPKPNTLLTSIYGFEIVCSGNWSFDGQFKPTSYVDISSEIEAKLSAWNFYEGEERPFPFPRSVEGLETLAKFRGLQSGLLRAEGFQVFREIF
jgi:LmbE family N-acetylglucosaminyl deacetylase